MTRIWLQLYCAAALTLTAGWPVIADAAESINAGSRQSVTANPFHAQSLATFDSPWAIGLLPDGRMLVTEKHGKIFLVAANGAKTAVTGVPAVFAGGQNGLLDIVAAPQFAENRNVYFTYTAPAKPGGALVLAKAALRKADGAARLEKITAIWKQGVAARGGQPGGKIAFEPGGKNLFLSVGDRMLPDTAQDPQAPMGKILRMTPDGQPAAGNPFAGEAGIRALTWSWGHRNPYGLAFAPDGKLWEHEMGPKGGDELNLIEPDKNYGWPLVSNGDNYNGTPIPRHSTRPDLQPPLVYWTPVIAPAGLAFYEGNLFGKWRGSALIGALRSQALVRVVFDRNGGADEAERYDMGHRIRDVAVAADGAVLVLEDGDGGRLLRLTPK